MRVEEDEEAEGDDADGDEAEPVKVDGVGGIHAELAHLRARQMQNKFNWHQVHRGGGRVVRVACQEQLGKFILENFFSLSQTLTLGVVLRVPLLLLYCWEGGWKASSESGKFYLAEHPFQEDNSTEVL